MLHLKLVVLALTQLTVTQIVALQSEGGDYVLSKMFEEPETCQFNQFYDHLETVSSFSLLDCGLKCSATTDCRRIMFDRKSKICRMFESGENCFHHEDIEDKVCYRMISICNDSVCARCPIGYYGDACQYIIKDCGDGHNRGIFKMTNLMSYIQPRKNGPIIEVKCNFNWGGMTYIQHRDKYCLETDFNRTWDEYVHGFGNKHGEYWMGLQNIYDILQNTICKLNVLMSNSTVGFQGYYRNFTLANSTENYKFHSKLYVDQGQNPIGDSLTNGSYNLTGRPFSTYDRDYSNNNCPDRFKSGWWYLNDPVCSRGNLNGRHNDPAFEASIHWLDNLGTYTDFSEVQIRLTRN